MQIWKNYTPRFACIPAVFERALAGKATPEEAELACEYHIEFDDGSRTVFSFRYGLGEACFLQVAEGEGHFTETIKVLRHDPDIARCCQHLHFRDQQTQWQDYNLVSWIYKCPSIWDNRHPRCFSLGNLYGASILLN